MTLTPIVLGTLHLHPSQVRDSIVVSVKDSGALIMSLGEWRDLERVAKLQATITVALLILYSMPRDDKRDAVIGVLELVKDPHEIPIGRAPADTPELRARIAEMQRTVVTRVTFNGEPIADVRTPIGQLVDGVRELLSRHAGVAAWSESHSSFSQPRVHRFKTAVGGREVVITIEVDPPAPAPERPRVEVVELPCEHLSTIALGAHHLWCTDCGATSHHDGNGWQLPRRCKR